MSQKWVEKLKKSNSALPHKTPAQNDRDADEKFLQLLDDEKTKEEAQNPTFKSIPKFFYKKP